VEEISALKVWQQTCQQLYLPRLVKDTVFHQTVQAGANSEDFFGLAQGKEGERYIGFSLGEPTAISLDTILLIEPGVARAYANSIREPVKTTLPEPGEPIGIEPPIIRPAGVPDRHDPGKRPTLRHFYGSIDLNPLTAKMQFADIVDEIVQQFTTQAGVTVRIAIEIQAESATGFNEGLQRTVRENCHVLKFGQAEFETGEE